MKAHNFQTGIKITIKQCPQEYIYITCLYLIALSTLLLDADTCPEIFSFEGEGVLVKDRGLKLVFGYILGLIL